MAESENSSNSKSLWQALNTEPLIPFALIGGLLFAAYGFAKPQTREVIELTPQTLQALENMEVTLRGRPLTEDERQQMIDSHIENEVLMREAFRRGLEKKDGRVRRRLLTMMRSALDEQVPEPTRADLEAFYRDRQEQFAEQPAVRFEQVFFGFGSEPDDPQAVLQRLRDGADHQQLGEPFLSPSDKRPATRQDLLSLYGPEFAKQVLSLPEQDWSGPLESGQGMHFVRLLERTIRPAPTFEQVEQYLRQLLLLERRHEVQRKKIAEMQKRYRVVFTDTE